MTGGLLAAAFALLGAASFPLAAVSPAGGWLHEGLGRSPDAEVLRGGGSKYQETINQVLWRSPDAEQAWEAGTKPTGERADTLGPASVTASAKEAVPLERLAAQTATVLLKDLRQRGLSAPKSLGGIVPNLHIPDYGSAMTSTVYMRGFGSRIDNPVIGLYIDDIPVMDKNMYDVEFLDIRRADFLSGPQGTLYGRNSFTGLLALSTLSPGDVSGTGFEVRCGAAGEVFLKASHYGGGIGAVAAYRHSDGFYVNEYDGSSDVSDTFSARLRFERRLMDWIDFGNILSVNALKQGGYPYGQYVDDTQLPVSYNRESGYRRVGVTEGVKLRASFPSVTLSGITSLQFMADRMDLDQDFTEADMFTLRQSQREWAVTEELILRPSREGGRWNHQSGVFAFYRRNALSAPVTFMEDGTRSLILDNANSGLETIGYHTDFKELSFPIESDFRLRTYNVAAYHESYFTLGRWLLTAGLRLDVEGNGMDYDSGATLHIATVPLGRDFTDGDYRERVTEYAGSITNGYCQLLPKLSALYAVPLPEGQGLSVYASVAKGYKAGGFNTQIFSDILQSRMMSEQFGVYLTDNPVTAANTTYKPETSYNAELGSKYSARSAQGELNISSTAFYIACRNQQMTVFPPGKGTGRMMANAGRSHSCGFEAKADGRWRGLSASLSYGYVDARFDEYDDGNGDYAGNHIPYSPQYTAYARLSYAWAFMRGAVRSLVVGADWNGQGKIRWDETGSLTEPPHGLLGADISLAFSRFTLYGRADNIADETYRVFYFKSMGNSFFQFGKPFRWTIGVRVEL